jgi:hypothetical protein
MAVNYYAVGEMGWVEIRSSLTPLRKRVSKSGQFVVTHWSGGKVLGHVTTAVFTKVMQMYIGKNEMWKLTEKEFAKIASKMEAP